MAEGQVTQFTLAWKIETASCLLCLHSLSPVPQRLLGAMTDVPESSLVTLGHRLPGVDLEQQGS